MGAGRRIVEGLFLFLAACAVLGVALGLYGLLSALPGPPGPDGLDAETTHRRAVEGTRADMEEKMRQARLADEAGNHAAAEAWREQAGRCRRRLAELESRER